MQCPCQGKYLYILLRTARSLLWGWWEADANRIPEAVVRMKARQSWTFWSLVFDHLCLYSQSTHKVEGLLSSRNAHAEAELPFLPLGGKAHPEAPKISECKKWNCQLSEPRTLNIVHYLCCLGLDDLGWARYFTDHAPLAVEEHLPV